MSVDILPELSADVREALLRDLPSADPDSARVLGEGWNATAWRVDAGPRAWVIRVPKLEWAAGEIERQTSLGPYLFEHHFPVPSGWRLFRRTDGSVLAGAYIYIDGVPAPVRGARALSSLASAVAALLTRLHALPTDFALRECHALDLDPWRGRYSGLMMSYASMTGARTQAWLEGAAERLERANHRVREHVLVHGDLAPEHLICDAAGRLVGVLDFSGPQVTDAAIDFSRLVQYWGVPFAESVLLQYERPVDDAFRERMVIYARLEPLRTIEAGVLRDLPQWVASGKRRLAASAVRESKEPRRRA